MLFLFVSVLTGEGMAGGQVDWLKWRSIKYEDSDKWWVGMEEEECWAEDSDSSRGDLWVGNILK